ncbi:hypothetical protein Mp_8g03940 [Marchantia polymorpha subsp. ruderalis]|uniref:AB hydrolase-1 domain-containing protein n=2 Tax=Marchantia polymorpha TaxID=3197 RepID=A0A176WU22_MARPO|nr:hypothetical protein AXG93_4225s1090 [Marchantia polymorpha subsp. ruderalis]PTQ46258.1 hypothetical protein MARPO_0012s0184 [Marchantia polymorpha]BBN18610.1 hypothetical protein Mp_8g03940 [Marchantia polymorpha subsp. ruderalis]|eukprot:PTQ46258.1 hypothetical protein MARPO_0012s0184 [Marchantia polymorpha]
MAVLAVALPHSVNDALRVLGQSCSSENSGFGDSQRLAVVKRSRGVKVGRKSQSCSARFPSSSVAISRRPVFENRKILRRRSLTSIGRDIPSTRVPTREYFRGAARNKEASTADESKAADSGPSLEEMLTPPTSMGLSSDTRMFTITVHGVITDNDSRRLESQLQGIDGIVQFWVGPLKVGGLRGGSVSVQIEIESRVTLRQVAQDIQDLDSSLLVLPFKSNTWLWRGHKINYAVAGCGEPIILVHGFGGNVGHFARLVSYLAEEHRVYAVDLLGFGASEKPLEANYGPELWGEQIQDFANEFADEGAVLVGNSIGSLTVLAAAAMMGDEAVRGVVLLNCAGAMNRKGLAQDGVLLRIISPIFVAVEYLLQKPDIAKFLFNRFRSKENVKKILTDQAYRNTDAVTDQLVDILHHPSTEPGALEVFVKVFTGEPGPRPEALMPKIKAPLLLLWGDKDRWTPANGPVANYFRRLGDERGNVYVETLPDVGHCPHDDRPELAAERMFSFIGSLEAQKN